MVCVLIMSIIIWVVHFSVLVVVFVDGMAVWVNMGIDGVIMSFSPDVVLLWFFLTSWSFLWLFFFRFSLLRSLWCFGCWCWRWCWSFLFWCWLRLRSWFCLLRSFFLIFVRLCCLFSLLWFLMVRSVRGATSFLNPWIVWMVWMMWMVWSIKIHEFVMSMVTFPFVSPSTVLPFMVWIHMMSISVSMVWVVIVMAIILMFNLRVLFVPCIKTVVMITMMSVFIYVMFFVAKRPVVKFVEIF